MDVQMRHSLPSGQTIIDSDIVSFGLKFPVQEVFGFVQQEHQ